MWCYWWRSPQTASQEIAHGTAMTQTDGSFTRRVCRPSRTCRSPEQDEPTFHYTVYADVTDTAGETRSANRDVNVGYTALAASMTADEWLTDGQPVEDRRQHADLGRRGPGGRACGEGLSAEAAGEGPAGKPVGHVLPRSRCARDEPGKAASKAPQPQPSRTCPIPTRGSWARWWARRASQPTRRARPR